MTYQLHAVGDGSQVLVGEYGDYAGALQARVNHVLDQLRGNDGWWTHAEHLIVGPGIDGPTTHYPMCTELGVDPADGRVPNEHDIDDARTWLLFAHELPGGPAADQPS
jgi:hypothetical protein